MLRIPKPSIYFGHDTLRSLCSWQQHSRGFFFGGNESSKWGECNCYSSDWRREKGQRQRWRKSGRKGGIFACGCCRHFHPQLIFSPFCPRKNAKKGSPARLCSFWQQKQLFIIFICITRIVVSLLFLVIYISQVFVYTIFRDSLRPKQEASIYVIFFFFFWVFFKFLLH